MAEEFSGFSNEQVKNAAIVKDSMAEIGNLTRSYNKAIGESEAVVAKVASDYRKIESGADKVAELQREAARSASATAKATKEQANQLNIVARLNARIDRLYKQSLTATGKTKENLEQQAKNLTAARDNAQSLANSFGKIAEDSAKLTRSNYVFSTLGELFRSLPGGSVLATPFEAAAEASRSMTIENAKQLEKQQAIDDLLKSSMTEGKVDGRKITDEKLKQFGLEGLIDKTSKKSKKEQLKLAKANLKTGNAGMAGLKAGAKALGPALTKAFAPLAIAQAIVSAIKVVFDAMLGADKFIVGMQRSLGLTKESAKATKELFMQEAALAQAKGLTFVTAEKLNETNDKLNDSLGLSVKFGQDINESFLVLTEKFRISEQTALKLLPTLKAFGGPVDKTLESMEGVVSQMRMSGETAMGFDDVLNAIGETSGLMRSRFGGSAESLVRSVTAARRLGMSLDEAHQMGSGLNDVQEAFVAQSNLAAVGLGDINVQRALELKAQGKSLQATQEIYNQFKKIPKEMRKMPHIQEMFNKAFGANIEQIEENLQKRKEEVALLEAREENLKLLQEEETRLAADTKLTNQEREVALKQYANKLGLQELDYKSLATVSTAQEEFNNAMAQAKSLFTDFVGSGAMETLTKVLKRLASHLGAGGTIFGFLRGRDAGAEQREANERALDQISQTQTGFKNQNEVGRMLNQLSNSGALNQETLNQVVKKYSIDKDLVRKEIDDRIKRYDPESEAGKRYKSLKVQDFTIKAHPKDTLVMAGGTRFGEETNKLLRELISAVKEGGDVVMDGNKVGYTLSMAGSKF